MAVGDAVHELLNAENFPGHERVMEAARALEDPIRWLLDGKELGTKVARAGHLLDHGVRVVERLLDAQSHENEDVDVARGWIARVEDYREGVDQEDD